MSNIFLNTMAMKITNATYPIAIACLPIGFRESVAATNAYDNYLVINVRRDDYLLINGKPSPEYENTWMTKDEFDEIYEFMDDEVEGRFVYVRQIQKNTSPDDGYRGSEAISKFSQDLEINDKIYVGGLHMRIDMAYVKDVDVILYLSIVGGVPVKHIPNNRFMLQLNIPKGLVIKVLR